MDYNFIMRGVKGYTHPHTKDRDLMRKELIIITDFYVDTKCTFSDPRCGNEKTVKDLSSTLLGMAYGQLEGGS